MRLHYSALAFLFAAGLSAAAHADTTSGSGGGFSGSGTLATTNNGDGSYTIALISGDGFDGMLAPGTFGDNDNLLFPNDPTVVDSNGFSFAYTMGDTDFNVNIFSSPDGSYDAYLADSDGFDETIPVTISVVDPPGPPAYTYFTFNIGSPSATPEPSSLVLLGTGLLGMCGAARRRMR